MQRPTEDGIVVEFDLTSGLLLLSTQFMLCEHVFGVDLVVNLERDNL
jgi:hypothetical protein